jgi:hypothetical protein
VSLEDLKNDVPSLDAALAELEGAPAPSVKDLINCLRRNHTAFIGLLVAEVDEIDSAVDQLVHQEGMISKESAGIIAAPMILADQLVAELEKLTTDLNVKRKCGEFRKLYALAIEELEECTDDESEPDQE